MVLNKFIQDLAKNSQRKQAIIEQEVEEFFRTSKVTEVSLKELKARVYAAVGNKATSSVADDRSDAGSRRSVGSHRSNRSGRSGSG